MASVELLSMEIICKCCLKPISSSNCRLRLTAPIREAFQKLMKFPLDLESSADSDFVCSRCYANLNSFDAFKREITSAHSKQDPAKAPKPETVNNENNRVEDQLKAMNLLKLKPKNEGHQTTKPALKLQITERQSRVEIVPSKSSWKLKEMMAQPSSTTFKKETIAQSSSSTDTADDLSPNYVDGKLSPPFITQKDFMQPKGLLLCCQHCGTKTYNADAFLAHMREDHNFIFMCQHCANIFQSEDQLNQHISHVHVDSETAKVDEPKGQAKKGRKQLRTMTADVPEKKSKYSKI